MSKNCILDHKFFCWMNLLIITLCVKAILPNSAKDVHVQLIKLNKF